MQRDERDVRAQVDQRAHQAVVDVDPVDLVAEPAQRLLDALPRLQRDLTLERTTPLEDRDAHQALPRRRPAVRNGTTGASAGAGCGARSGTAAEPERGRLVPVSDA